MEDVMSTRKEHNEKGQFSLSAMIDVVFLLLLFFVATFVSERTEAYLSVNNPTGTIGEPGPPPMEAEVHPSEYRFMGRAMPLDKLEDQLMAMTASNTEVAVFIKVNPSASEGELLDLLDRCSKVNLTNLNIQTLKE
jgi:biopolymer transport protein ExbD